MNSSINNKSFFKGLKNVAIFLMLFGISMLNVNMGFAQMGVSETAITPDASSILELKSTSKGFLAPRMTAAQRAAISSPATGLIVYQTDGTTGFYFYDGSAWALLGKQITFSTGLTNTSNTVTVNTTQNISKLSNLTTNGIVTTSSSDGTLGVTSTLPIANGGTNATTKAAAFDNLSPMSASGDIIYGGVNGTGTSLAKGSDGQVLSLASGIPSWSSVPGTFIAMKVITSGTSYTPSTGTQSIMVELVGAGGGGGGAKSQWAVASGGGAGGYAKKYITGISSSTSYTIAIGTGGAGGLATGATGTSGGSTTFATGSNASPASTTFTAAGGSGGVGNSSGTTKTAIIGGAGGTSTSNTSNLADIAYSGQSGSIAFTRGNAEGAWSGMGGSTLFGSGGIQIFSQGSSDLAGNVGSGYGAGGGGAYGGSATGAAGGAGTKGVIIIYEYR